MRGTRGGLLAIVVGLAALAPLVGNGGAAATPSSLLLDPIPAHFVSPTYVTAPPGDATRLFVVEQGGTIQLYKNSTVSLFMTVPGVTSGGERGLLSMAFAPDYAASGIFYVYYTRSQDGAIQVDEFHRDAANPDIGNPATVRHVLTVPHPGESNHNGGQLQFGPDGMLYLGTGDGGGGGDPFRAAMNLQDLRGKILRIDPREQNGQPYSVPANNPFVGHAGAWPEIWSYGLRNPWRFSFDRITRNLSIGDVGQNQYEEIDYGPVDLGWGRGVELRMELLRGASRVPHHRSLLRPA